MSVTVPIEFVEVPVSDFEEYLKTCPDYTRQAYCEAVKYYYRHRRMPFAYVTGFDTPDEKVFVDPNILSNGLLYSVRRFQPV